MQRPYADATRVGVWGWSNGGTMTLDLLFHSPSVYQVGMAVAPVSDQRFYDTIYTERYMGLPQDNPGAYRLASPVTFADSLRGKLLLVHGSGDDNVHFQNSETRDQRARGGQQAVHDDGLPEPHPLHLRGRTAPRGTSSACSDVICRDNLPAGGR